MPTPNKGESHDDWMKRCMADPEQQQSFPDPKQCAAVCESKWEEHQKQMGMKTLKIIMRDDLAEVLLYDEIGEDPFFGLGISAKTFREQIRGIKAKTINLRINSPGGSVTDGAAMLAALDEFKGRVEVDIDGMAASAASVIAMGGDSIRMASNALLMIHDPHAAVMGTAADMRSTAELLDKVKGQILDAYARRAKVSKSKLAEMMTAETWFTPKEAIDAGLADSVTDTLRVAAYAVPEKFRYKHVPAMPGPTAKQLAEFQARKRRIREFSTGT